MISNSQSSSQQGQGSSADNTSSFQAMFQEFMGLSQQSASSQQGGGKGKQDACGCDDHKDTQQSQQRQHDRGHRRGSSQRGSAGGQWNNSSWSSNKGQSNKNNQGSAQSWSNNSTQGHGSCGHQQQAQTETHKQTQSWSSQSNQNNCWTHEQQDNSCHSSSHSNNCQPKPEQEDCKPVPVTGGSIQGDPHFVGADGSHYDVQGEAGKTYNLLSDKGVQVNAQFQAYGGGGATTIGAVGITSGNSQIQVDKDGSVTVDGEKVAGDGTYADGAVTKAGNNITVKAGEYTMKIAATGGYLNLDFASDNATADNVKPNGLWGLTADGGPATNGTGAQGGGVLETAAGVTSQAGDTTAVKNYEVGDLFDTTFNSFTNVYNANQAQNNNHRNRWAA